MLRGYWFTEMSDYLLISVLNILKSWLCESLYYLRDFKFSPPDYIVPLLVVNGNEGFLLEGVSPRL